MSKDFCDSLRFNICVNDSRRTAFSNTPGGDHLQYGVANKGKWWIGRDSGFQ